VHQFLVFATGSTFPTTIFRSGLFARNVLGIRQSQSQTSRSFRTKEQLRMTHPAGFNRFYEVLFDRFLPNNFFELHACKIRKISKYHS
jgi:hypothetical protein